MRNIIKETLFFTLFLFIVLYLYNYSTEISNIVQNSFEIWLKNVFPILFPTFILSDIFIHSNLPYYIEKYLHIPYIYIISVLFGSPTNAYILNNYNEDLTKYLAVTKYTSLLFTITYLKSIFSKLITTQIILSNILSNIILIIILKPNRLLIKKKNYNILLNIPQYINKSIMTNINILGTIIFYSLIPIYMIKNNYLKTILLSFLEVTTSLQNIKKSPITYNIKILSAIISTSTTGLCIETQIKNIIDNNKYNQKKYLIYRTIHFILQLSIFYILIIFFK